MTSCFIQINIIKKKKKKVKKKKPIVNIISEAAGIAITSSLNGHSVCLSVVVVVVFFCMLTHGIMYAVATVSCTYDARAGTLQH